MTRPLPSRRAVRSIGGILTDMSPVDWQAFFTAHAPHYDENGFAQNTVAEIDFFLNLFPLQRGARILDIGCGTGRHAVELAKRGFDVTGLDLTPAMLARASAKAEAAGVSVNLVQGNARAFSFDVPFDAAICLCEGGFGLLGAGEDPDEQAAGIFQSAHRALKPGGSFLLTGLNGYSAIRRFQDESTISGAFDPATMIAEYDDEWDLPEGKQIVTVRERLFIAPEVVRHLRNAGFRVDAVYGGTAGHWDRRPLMLDEVEAMFVCRRP